MGGKSDGEGAGMEIVSLAPELVEEAAALLAEAFRTEEITSYHVDMSRTSAMRRMRIMDGILLRLYLEAGRPVVAAVNNGNLVGVGLVRDPRRRVSARRAVALALPNLFQLAALFAPRPLRTVRVIKAVKHPKVLSKPFFTFEVLGVHPDHQGMGAGKALMRRVQAMVEEDPEISGIYLNTGSEKNQAFYESLGYDTMRVVDLGQVRIYHMFWHNPAFWLGPMGERLQAGSRP